MSNKIMDSYLQSHMHQLLTNFQDLSKFQTLDLTEYSHIQLQLNNNNRWLSYLFSDLHKLTVLYNKHCLTPCGAYTPATSQLWG